MKRKFADPPIHYQEKVTTYFQSLSSHWNDVYTSSSVFAETIQARHVAVLDWIDSLALAPGSQVLDIGCGAALMAIALAQRGLRVQAIDSSEAMVQQARRNVAESGIANLLEVNVSDVYSLPFKDNSFDLVIAIGVFPWLSQAELAIQEMARVTRPEGHVILTAANRMGLPEQLDPQLNPALAPLRQHLRALLERVGLRVRRHEQLPKMIYHRRRFIDEILLDAGLLKIRDKTLGFGPFTFFCRSVLPNRLGLTLHHRLQRLADRNVPLVRSIGMSYHVLTRKTTPCLDRNHSQGTPVGKRSIGCLDAERAQSELEQQNSAVSTMTLHRTLPGLMTKEQLHYEF